MAMFSHRLRRALVAATSNFYRTVSPSPVSLAAASNFTSVSAVLQRSVLGRETDVARAPVRCFSTRQYKLYKEGDEITEDTVLFEGCDYNHWLFTMDFPKDNPPSPEEMVATYEQTCAKGLGISVEEAKKRIYACSTTTYQGFQAVMTEAESEKFKDVPGVVFILPDSYIDPQNKEYGGDKYENGVITHRPPPVQYGRTRPRDRNNRFDRQGGGPQNFQRNTQYGPQQNYRTPEQGQGQTQMPSFQPGYNQGQGSTVPPPYQGGYNQGQGAPVPPYQTGFNQGQGSPVPPYQGGYNQGQRTPNNYGQGGSGNYNHGPQGNYNQGGPRNNSPQNNGNYGPPAHGTGNPGYSGQGRNQPFPQTEQRTAPGDWNNNNPPAQPGSDQFPQGRRY